MAELSPREYNQPSRLGEIFEAQKDKFISPELLACAQVPDRVRVLSNKQSEVYFELLIIDGSASSLDEIETRFDLMELEDLERFQEATAKLDFPDYYRPLLFVSAWELTPDMLYIGRIDINADLRDKGVGSAFYKTLEDLSRQERYRFITGHQEDADTAKFFLERGRYILNEVKEELQPQFKELMQQDQAYGLMEFATIKFLNPQDASHYIKPECMKSSIEERIEKSKPRLTES